MLPAQDHAAAHPQPGGAEPAAHPGRARRRTAAFYDLDGTLLDGSVVDHYLYYARSDPRLPSRVRRVAETVVKAPYYMWVDRLDRRRFNEEFYRSYAGLSEDRLAILGETLFEQVLSKKVYDGVHELVAQDRAAGHHQVLLTGALDFVAGPVARHFQMPTVIASRLEYAQNGLATGVLRPPVMAGPEKASWIRRFAAEHDIDLDRSVAYADDAADLPMLSMVGRPVAVNPEPRLLATARSHGWPVLWIETDNALASRLARGAAELTRQAVRRVRDEAAQRTPGARAALQDSWSRLRALAAEARGRAEEARRARQEDAP